MLACDRCSTPIPDDSRFCPTCGDPVTAADETERQGAQSSERVKLVCPACDKPSLHDIASHGAGEVTCPLCQALFETRVVSIRSKRSAGNKALNTRRFTVRAEELGGREDLIEFNRRSSDDFELRSRDLAAFSSLEGRLHVVQNLTLGLYMKLVSRRAVPRAAPPVYTASFTPAAPAAPVARKGGGGWIGAVVAFMLLLGVISMCGDADGPRGSYAPASRPSYEAPVLPVADTGSSGAQSSETMYVHGALNVRGTPERKGTLVRKLSRGTLVRLGPKDANGWAPLYDASGTREGYVYRASNAVQANRPAEPARASPRRSSASSAYHRGPRGGCYTYTASGNKRYVERWRCD